MCSCGEPLMIAARTVTGWTLLGCHHCDGVCRQKSCHLCARTFHRVQAA